MMPRKATGNANGRPSYIPTEDDRKTVSLMCAVGIPHEGIALCIGDDGIDDKTLRKYFKRELETAKIRANTKICGKLFNLANSGHFQAAKFWAQTQAHWTQINTHEITGVHGGAPIQSETKWTVEFVNATPKD